MAAVFGIVGTASARELDEMGARLAHRGAFATWREVANNVYLGQCDHVQKGPDTRGTLSLVVDAADGLTPGVSERIQEIFHRDQKAATLDALVRVPFTLAAWDDASQTLLLGRDFLGLKPLHFTRLPSGGVAFATEYKALLAIVEVIAAPDREALRCLQMYKAVPAGKTLLAGIEPVPPGCVLHVGRGGEIRFCDQMSPINLAVQPMTEAQASDALLARLIEATQPLVEGRSRIGLALSGGIDSMSVAFLARKCAPQTEIVGFTAGEHDEDPEVHRAATVMQSIGGPHVPIVVPNAELAAKLPLAVWHLENPIGRSETFQYFALAKLARSQGFDCLLTGMGSDLLFGGMPRHKVLWMAEVMPWLRKDLLAFFESTQTGEPAPRALARIMTRLYYGGSLPPAPSVIDCNRTFQPELLAAPGPEFINRCLMLDGQEPTSRTLARIERPLQAYGMDYGSPYLDKSLIQFAFTIPSALKIRRGTQKWILRRAMQPLMSAGLRRARKELMRMEQGDAFALTLHQLADRYLSAERIRRRGFFDHAQVEAIRRACRGSCHPETAMRLWTLIVTEIWAEIYLDARGRCPQPGRASSAPLESWSPVATAALS